MKIELLHVSALSDTLTEHPCKRQKERHNTFSTQIWTCIFYTILYISWGSLPETWQEEGWNNTAFFSFQFTYIADSKKTRAFSVAPPWIWTDAERKCGHVNWYVLRSFKKNVVWGLNLCFWTAFQNLPLTSLPVLTQVENLFQDYWSTVHWFLYCKRLTALDCSRSKGHRLSSEPVVSLR